MTLDNNHTRVKAELDNDYLSIYKALFSPVPTSSDEWKTALLELFSQQGQVYHMPLQQHDFGAYVNFCPYYNVPCLYRGSFHFYISVVCLSQGTSEIVDSMVSFLKEVSNAFINVNARVALTPLLPPEYCSGHMTYFGSSIPEDGSHQCYDFLPSEWYRHYYFCGAEWFNILSPLVRKHIPTLLEDARLFPSLVVEELPSGSVYVQTKKAIEILDVADLLPSKLLLYDALYPGKMKIKKQYILSQKTTGLISKPRKKWEIVPILPNEITIEDESITFLHGRNIEDQKTDLLN